MPSDQVEQIRDQFTRQAQAYADTAQAKDDGAQAKDDGAQLDIARRNAQSRGDVNVCRAAFHRFPIPAVCCARWPASYVKGAR